MPKTLSRQAIYNKHNTVIGYKIDCQLLEDREMSDERKDYIIQTLSTLAKNLPIFVTDNQYSELKPFFANTPNEKINIFIKSNSLPNKAKELIDQGLHVILQIDQQSDLSTDNYHLIDVIEISINQPIEFITDIISKAKQYDKTCCLSDINSEKDFDKIKNLEIDLFYGDFVTKPNLENPVCKKQNGLMIMRLLSLLQNEDTALTEIEEAISQDPRLAFKLLKTVNSPFYGFTRHIETIREAILLIGLLQIKRWASLAAMSNIEGKPDELITLAVTRAKMCELISEGKNIGDPDQSFMTGLFSTLDALFDTPMPELLSSLNLDEVMTKALLQNEGELGKILELVLLYENAMLEGNRINSTDYELLVKSYVTSIEYADSCTLN